MNSSIDFSRSDMSNLKKMINKSPKAFNSALEKASIQLLTWMNTGSGGTAQSAKPPIRWGVLRGSSSAFVGPSKIIDFRQQIKAGSRETITPASSYSAPKNTITVVWNTDYADKMHEWPGPWGEFTERDGDAGAKWVEKHLKADKDLLMKVIGLEFKQELRL